MWFQHTFNVILQYLTFVNPVFQPNLYKFCFFHFCIFTLSVSSTLTVQFKFCPFFQTPNSNAISLIKMYPSLSVTVYFFCLSVILILFIRKFLPYSACVRNIFPYFIHTSLQKQIFLNKGAKVHTVSKKSKLIQIWFKCRFQLTEYICEMLPLELLWSGLHQQEIEIMIFWALTFLLGSNDKGFPKFPIQIFLIILNLWVLENSHFPLRALGKVAWHGREDGLSHNQSPFLHVYGPCAGQCLWVHSVLTVVVPSSWGLPLVPASQASREMHLLMSQTTL